MNFKTTLILLVLVIIGGGVLFVVTQNQPDTKPPKKEEGDRRIFANLKTDDVKKVVIKSGTGDVKPLEMNKSADGKWQVTQPGVYNADTFEAGNLVSMIADLRSKGQTKLSDKAGAGLDKPRYLVELTDGTGKVDKLQIGNRSALGTELYLIANDNDSIDVAPGGSLSSKLEEGLGQLEKNIRDKVLVDVPAATVKEMRITRKGQSLHLVKQGEEWKVVEPKQVPADSAEVSNVLSLVSNLRADEFVDAGAPELTAAMLDQPRVTVWFTTTAPATQPTSKPADAKAPTTATTQPGGTTVIIGQYADVEKSKTFVKVGDVIAKATFSDVNYKKIADASPLSLRDRKVLEIDPERVNKVTISRDLLATTQPTTKPAEKAAIVLARREEKLIPVGPPAPAKTETPAAPKVEDPAQNKETPAPKTEVPAPKTEAPAAPKEESPAPAKSEPKADVRTPGGDGTVRLALYEDAPKDAKASEVKPPEPAPTKDAEPARDAPKSEVKDAPKSEVKDAPKTDAKDAPAKTDAAPGDAAKTQAAGGEKPPTAPATTPAVPPEPPAVWQLQSEPKGDADDTKVQGILDALHPFKADKYLEAMPKDLKPVGTYTVKIDAASKGDKPAQTFEIKLTDPGAEKKLIAEYGGLIFEVDRSFADKITGDFTKKKGEAAKPPSLPPGFGAPGGLPFGQ